MVQQRCLYDTNLLDFKFLLEESSDKVLSPNVKYYMLKNRVFVKVIAFTIESAIDKSEKLDLFYSIIESIKPRQILKALEELNLLRLFGIVGCFHRKRAQMLSC